MPMTTDEAQKHGNYAPWADHRAYMEDGSSCALSARLRDLVHEIDPGGRASISGTQVPTAHNGCNWYAIDQQIDYLQPYSGGNQDAMHYLFRPGLPITGFTGYGLMGSEAEARAVAAAVLRPQRRLDFLALHAAQSRPDDERAGQRARCGLR